MCTSPYWRIPVKEAYLSWLFTKSEIKHYNRTNQAFFFSKEDTVYFEFILNRIESRIPRIFEKTVNELTECPCGYCEECKLKESKQWAQRAVLESTCHAESWFITLTYDDEHLPEPYWTYNRNGDYGLWSPLKYEDFEAFKKRLLRHFEYYYNCHGIRFLMCGEYGPKTHRPHFHCILYGCVIPDLKAVSDVNYNGKKYTYLHSDLIEKTWGKGFITIGNVTWESTAYVARYVMKKLKPNDELAYLTLCERYNKIPLPAEMRQASRRPGLGRPYYEQHKDDIYRIDKVVMPDGKTLQPCSYFDKIFDLEDPELLEQLKTQRKLNRMRAEQNEFAHVGARTPEQQKAYKLNKSAKQSRSLKKLERTL